MNFYKFFMLALATGLLLASCGNKNQKETQETGVPAKATNITASVVPKTYQYSGNVASVKKSTLSTRIMGQIENVYAHKGDEVKKGQLLLAIRSNDILAKKSQVEANILEITAAYKNAEADFNRINALYSTQSATKKELDDITTHFNMMKAKLKAAQKAKAEIEEMMTYANIRAPYAGVITNRFVDAGDMANPGMPLLAIEAPGQFEVITRIPESEIHLVNHGDTVKVMLKNSKESITGIVSRVSTSSRLSGAQFETSVQLLPSPEQKKFIRSGMFAQVKLNKGVDEKIMVSKDLIINRGQLTGIWTVSGDNQALMRWVRLGKMDNDQVEVLSGLSEGDRLITECNERLYDGLLLDL